MNRQSIARINRWLGWISVPITFLAFYTRYVENWRLSADPTQQAVYLWVNILVGVLPLVHAAITLFLFGIPRYSSNPKIVHIWIGYLVLLVILVSQSLAGTGIVYDIATILMYLTIVAHTILGFKYAMARRAQGDTMAELHRANRAKIETAA
jgi:hypothetical protein